MSNLDFNFFSTGNTRNLGTSFSKQSWQESLYKIDQFLHTSNTLALSSDDIIFQKNKDVMMISREITGFVSGHELVPLELFVEDKENRYCAAVKIEQPYEAETDKVFNQADEIVRGLQHIEFPKDYVDFNDFEVRLRMDFKTIDQLKSDWLVYMFFNRGSSSILTF